METTADSETERTPLIQGIEKLARDRSESKSVLEWLNRTKELHIAAVGKTGVGKSTLLNGFLGAEIGDRSTIVDEGESFYRVTKKVEQYQFKKNGIKVIVWDCPGMEDGMEKEDEYLQQLQSMSNGNIHLMLYCVNMLETRADFHCGVRPLTKITEFLGKDILWKSTALILTHANIYEESRLEGSNQEKRNREFSQKVQEWQKKFHQSLKTIGGIEQSVIDEISVLPAGKDACEPLCGQKNWLSDLWAEILNKVRPDVQRAVIKINSSRMRNPEEVTEEDLKVDMHNQPIILTSKVQTAIIAAMLETGGIAGGAAAGAAIGASVGAVSAGTVSFGLASGIGAGIGAGVGGGIGLIAAIVLAVYRHKKPAYQIPDQKGT